MKKLIAVMVIVSFFGCNKNDYISVNSSDKSAVMFSAFSGGNFAAPSFPKIPYTPDGSVTDEYLSFQNNGIKTKFDGPVPAPADITITYKVDAAALTKYNADHATVPGYKPFNLMPDSTFSLLVTSDLIKKGEIYAPKVTNNIVTHPQKIDPSKNYMIPITVSNSSYPAVAGGSGTIFYSIIGNPLAGNYNVTGYVYHPTLPRPFKRPDAAAGLSGALIPVTDTSLVTELGDLGTSGYYAVLSVHDPYATTIQHVTVSVYPGSISPVYQWDTGLPTTGTPLYTPQPLPDWGKSALCNNTYDPATKTFYMRYGYLGANGWRVTEEILVKQ